MPDPTRRRDNQISPIAVPRILSTLFIPAIILAVCLGSVCCVSNGIPSVASASAATLSASTLNFGHSTVGGAGTPQILSILNSGNASLLISSITVTGSDAKDFGQTNDCGDALAAGSSCFVKVTFKPSAAGSRTADLNIVPASASSAMTVALSGTATGAAPAISLSSASLNFGSSLVGKSAGPENLTVTNSGNESLSISSIGFTGGDADDFAQTNTCADSLAAAAQCVIRVTFKPSAAGTRTAELSILDNAAGSPQMVTLSGTGTATSPAITLSGTSITFGNDPVGVAAGPDVLTVTNSGNASLALTSVGISGTNSGDFAQTNTCGSSLAAGAQCAVRVTFKPTASGKRSADLNLVDNAAGSPQTVTLSGTATAPAVTLSAASFSFGSAAVGVTAGPASLGVTNSGTAPLTITSIGFTGGNAGDFAQTNTCGTSLASGAVCAVRVTFKPSATGARATTLKITDNAGAGYQVATFSGSATAANTSSDAAGTPAVTLSASTVSFSILGIEFTSPVQVVTLKNSGTATLNITGVTVTGADSSEFVENNTCGTSVAAGAQCTIVMLFTPLALGTRTATLVIADNASTSPQAVSLSGGGSHDVVLSWTPSPTPSLTGYYIFRGTTPGGESLVPLNLIPLSGTSYDDTTVTAGSTYYYVLTSVTANGGAQSVTSSEVTATVP